MVVGGEERGGGAQRRRRVVRRVGTRRRVIVSLPRGCAVRQRAGVLVDSTRRRRGRRIYGIGVTPERDVWASASAGVEGEKPYTRRRRRRERISPTTRTTGLGRLLRRLAPLASAEPRLLVARRHVPVPSSVGWPVALDDVVGGRAPTRPVGDWLAAGHDRPAPGVDVAPRLGGAALRRHRCTAVEDRRPLLARTKADEGAPCDASRHRAGRSGSRCAAGERARRSRLAPGDRLRPRRGQRHRPPAGRKRLGVAVHRAARRHLAGSTTEGSLATGALPVDEAARPSSPLHRQRGAPARSPDAAHASSMRVRGRRGRPGGRSRGDAVGLPSRRRTSSGPARRCRARADRRPGCPARRRRRRGRCRLVDNGGADELVHPQDVGILDGARRAARCRAALRRLRGRHALELRRCQ